MERFRIAHIVQADVAESLTRQAAAPVLTVLLAAGLAGCAGLAGGHYGPGPLAAGDSSAQVLARMGTPDERRELPGAASAQAPQAAGAPVSRWVYVRGPMGRHTYMIDLDRQGRVTGWFNALEPQRLQQIVPAMSQSEVLQRLGPPAERRALALEGRTLWAWRFPTYDCEWFVATFDARQQVLDAGTMTDPRCDVDID